MSVIFGALLPDTVYLAADRRAIDMDTHKITSEDEEKIIVCNPNVAIGVTGRQIISQWIFHQIKTGNQTMRDTFLVDDWVEIVDGCLNEAINHPDLVNAQYAVAVAGKMQDGSLSIMGKVSSENVWKRQTTKPDTLMSAVLPPPEVTQQQCEKILYMRVQEQDCPSGNMMFALHDAIQDVAQLAHSVNARASIWKLGKTRLNHFG